MLYWLSKRHRTRLGLGPLPRSKVWAFRQDPPAPAILWKPGWPIEIANFLEVGAFAGLTETEARVGNLQRAAHHIVLQSLHFAFLSALSIREGSSVLTA